MNNDEFRLRQVREMLWQLNEDSKRGEPTITLVNDLNNILHPCGLIVEMQKFGNWRPRYLIAVKE